MVALLSRAAARSRSSSDSQTCFSGPLSYAFCCSWNSSNGKRGVQPFLRTISMPACCFATADSTTTACVQLPYLGNVSLLPFLRTIAKQRQALAHLYSALISLLQNKDKHFPISTQHLLRCYETKISHLERWGSMGHSRCVGKQPCLPSENCPRGR